jgi:nucleoside diphosphate kinase
MALKFQDLSREQVDKMVREHEIRPIFNGQNPYIASGPNHEILVGLLPNGLYQVELLDKQQTEASLQQTIQAFKDYTDSVKSLGSYPKV